MRPAARLQVGLGRIVVAQWETFLKLAFGHLVDWLRTFCHGGYPSNLECGRILPWLIRYVKSGIIARRHDTVITRARGRACSKSVAFGTERT